MEEFIFFRLFLAFPVIGLLIPDLGLLFSGLRISRIPVTHLIIEVTLSVCIIICSLGMWYFKRKQGGKIAGGKSLIGA